MFHLLRLVYDMGKKLVLELMTNKLRSASLNTGLWMQSQGLHEYDLVDFQNGLSPPLSDSFESE